MLNKPRQPRNVGPTMECSVGEFCSVAGGSWEVGVRVSHSACETQRHVMGECSSWPAPLHCSDCIEEHERIGVRAIKYNPGPAIF